MFLMLYQVFCRLISKKVALFVTVIWLFGITLLVLAASDLFTQNPINNTNGFLFIFSIIPSFIAVLAFNFFGYNGFGLLEKR